MAIDKIPKVGRFLFTESMLRDGFFRRTGTITKISGKRIYYDEHKDSTINTERFIHRKTLAAVCDTSEEIEALRSFNSRALAEVGALKARHKEEAARFFDNEVSDLPK